MQIMDADPKPRIWANARKLPFRRAARRRCKIFNIDSKDSHNIRGYRFIQLFSSLLIWWKFCDSLKKGDHWDAFLKSHFFSIINNRFYKVLYLHASHFYCIIMMINIECSYHKREEFHLFVTCLCILYFILYITKQK